MRELLLIFMAMTSFVSMTYALHCANKQSHDVVSGVVKIRDDVYQCKPWKYTKK